MGLCFATGSRQVRDVPRPLRVLHGVEYLRYDIPKERVDVAADFFVQNETDEPAALIGLHPGSVRFETSEDWLSGEDHWASLFRRIVAEKIGLRFYENKSISLCQNGHKPLPVGIAKGALGAWWPAAPPVQQAVPFTGWTGPVIPAQQLCVFSLVGTIQGPTYNELMPNDPAVDGISIMGGGPLLKKMRADMAEGVSLGKFQEYADAFDNFEKTCLRDPNFYHVVFEQADGRPFRPVYVSSESWRGCLNHKVGNRCVSWYWSDRELDVNAKTNGPVLELLTAAHK